MSEVCGQAVVRPSKSRHGVSRAGAPYSVVSPHAIASLCIIAEAAPPGCFVEVGVYRGGTAYYLNQIAQEQGRKLYLYDTFEGIPYQNEVLGDRHKVGDFGDTSVSEVAKLIPEAIIVKGVFPSSIIPMPPIAFVHVDCDQYQAIIDTVLTLKPLMVPGGIMVFDDYGCLEGATIAVESLFQKDQIELSPCGKAVVTF